MLFTQNFLRKSAKMTDSEILSISFIEIMILGNNTITFYFHSSQGAGPELAVPQFATCGELEFAERAQQT